jgi:hypothetical protein
LDKLIAPGLLFIPVIVNQQIAHLRINPAPHAFQRPFGVSDDPLYKRTDECLKLLGVAIAHSVALGRNIFASLLVLNIVYNSILFMLPDILFSPVDCFDLLYSFF